jgi:hypothetical protein
MFNAINLAGMVFVKSLGDKKIQSNFFKTIIIPVAPPPYICKPILFSGEKAKTQTSKYKQFLIYLLSHFLYLICKFQWKKINTKLKFLTIFSKP